MAAIRSHEDNALASLFARTLENLMALTQPENGRAQPTVAEILNAMDTDVQVSPTLYRLVQLVVLPQVFGASSGSVLYVAAKRFSTQLELRSLQDLKTWFADMNLGELEIELDEVKVLVKLQRCLTCHHLTAVGSPLCDFERGLIDGVLEVVTGKTICTKETLCWGLGDTVCQFEGYASDEGDYIYAEDGYHREVQRRLLAGIADLSETALENLRLVSERHTAETHDALTGMYNFRHLREHAAFEVARARRYDRHVAFVMLDIDDFARVNAAVGDEQGDIALRAWADALAAQLRTCDLICRYGSDEFLLILPETADEGADAALERILQALKEVDIEAAGQTFALTATAGVATFPDDGGLVEELVAKATTTMYVVKSKGPAQVGFFSPPAGL